MDPQPQPSRYSRWPLCSVCWLLPGVHLRQACPRFSRPLLATVPILCPPSRTSTANSSASLVSWLLRLPNRSQGVPRSQNLPPPRLHPMDPQVGLEVEVEVAVTVFLPFPRLGAAAE